MTDQQTVESLNWLHSLVQELENNRVELPMGDYTSVYWIIESVREIFERAHTCDEPDQSARNCQGCYGP